MNSVPNEPRATPSAATKIDRAAALDIVSRAVLGGFFALCASVYLTHALAAIRALGSAPSLFEQAVNVLSVLAMTFFMGLVAYLYAVRLPPISKFAGWAPAAAAVIGSFANWTMLLLHPRLDLSISLKLAAALFILVGNIFAIYALRYLGRSFSILPQGRRLVTGGPYRYVRHPVYLAEAVATIGAMINFLSVPAVLLVLVQFFFQFVRMHFEEQVLRTTFPEYEEYRRHTARLFPGIY